MFDGFSFFFLIELVYYPGKSLFLLPDRAKETGSSSRIQCFLDYPLQVFAEITHTIFPVREGVRSRCVTFLISIPIHFIPVWYYPPTFVYQQLIFVRKGSLKPENMQ
jgi:hypothetical protein